MSEADLQAMRAAAFVVSIAFCVAMQRLLPHGCSKGSVRVNFGLWLIDTLLVAAVCGACGFIVAMWASQAGFGLLGALQAPPWVVVVGTVLGLDLVSYAWHRLNHAVTFLWRFHQVHHSDESYTVSTGARFHPGEILFSLPIRLCAIALLGASPLGVLAFEAVFTLANFFEHGDIRLPLPLERVLGRVFVLPALHRRHHSRLPDELNTNFATIFIFWDRALGTYGASSSARRFEIGLPERTPYQEIGRVLLLPLQVTRGWRRPAH